MPSPCIVVIDDHPAVRDSLTIVLGVAGYDVVIHPNAAGAVLVITRLQPVVVLIDLHVEYPLAGLDVVRALRADPATSAIPLVVWSSDLAVGYHVVALQLADVGVVSKFDNAATVLAALARAAAGGDQGDDPAA